MYILWIFHSILNSICMFFWLKMFNFTEKFGGFVSWTLGSISHSRLYKSCIEFKSRCEKKFPPQVSFFTPSFNFVYRNTHKNDSRMYYHCSLKPIIFVYSCHSQSWSFNWFCFVVFAVQVCQSCYFDCSLLHLLALTYDPRTSISISQFMWIKFVSVRL